LGEEEMAVAAMLGWERFFRAGSVFSLFSMVMLSL
jgi:hypothetical protein